MGHKSLHKDKHKKKHKKEKSKKHKKEKKLKKEKTKYKSDSSGSSSSDSEPNTEYKNKTEDLKRSEWDFLGAVLNNSHSTAKDSKKTQKQNTCDLDRPGQSSRELNPYWKNGGTGLPPTEEESRLKNEAKDAHIAEFNKQKLKFLKPGESSNFTSSRSNFQGNWRKKEIKEPDVRENKVESSQDEVNKPTSSVSNEDLNKIAAKLVKAEIMGNTSLINKLKAELEAAKKASSTTEKSNKEVVIVTDKIARKSDNKESYVPSKKQKTNTHDSGKRVRYFPDDDKYSLKNLFEKEKGAAEEDILVPSKLNVKSPDELDDLYLDAAASDKMQQKLEERKNKRAQKEAVVKHKTLEGCGWCLDNRNKTKHLVVSLGDKCYLSLPEEESLTEGHCMIVPLQHEVSSLHLDEDVWNEIKTYQRVLTRMFLEQDQDVIFFENARSFKYYPHCVIQCVPVSKEMGDLAPIYFQKAISESETEWSNNKKLIDFRKKDLQKSIPKGLPYFAVSFGTEGGFAHIIEDEYLFKKNFAEEVLGGMMDLDHSKWRKPQKDNFRAQREKALKFLKDWKKFEFNKNVPDTDSSDSDSD